MSHWEKQDGSDEYYTPKYLFDGMNVRFDLDVASPEDRTFVSVPADTFFTSDALNKEWFGFVWMNPPFSGRNSKSAWLNKLRDHGNGIALTPDRSSAPWWQQAATEADCVFFVKGKIKFVRPDGSVAGSPSTGTTLFGYGRKAVKALRNAEANGLGLVLSSSIF